MHLRRQSVREERWVKEEMLEVIKMTGYSIRHG